MAATLQLIDAADRPVHLDEADHLPAILTPADMQAIFRIKHSSFFRFAKAGYFDRFLMDAPGVRRWSGAKVAAFLKAGGRDAMVFGRKRAG